ncbi:TniQ family protein [Streptomyces sp. NPDC059176]|uniref:TniQ family protein n=1 Tax=Streptomyces sp. NPDC059176 TaxID=3346758 RepID=UPI003686C07D
MSIPRTLPLRFLPLPGEALDSWFEALAHRLRTPLGELLPQLGLPRPEHRKRTQDIPTEWTVMLRPHETEAIATVCRIAPDTLGAMTLAAYDGRAVFIDSDTRHVERRLLWGRGRGSRYCPPCLAETGGRWRLEWRLGWSFACMRHHCLLLDACPACGRSQRDTPHPRLLPVHPGHCPHPRPVDDPEPQRVRGHRRPRCGADLRDAPVLTLSEEHPALAAQQHALDLIASGTASFGTYANHPVPAAQALADLRAIAGRALADTSASQLARRLPDDLLAAYRQARAHEPVPRGPARADARPGFMAPSQAAVAAVGVTAAVEILTAPDIRQAAERMRWLTTEARERDVTVTASTLSKWGSGTSPVLLATQLVSLEEDFRPSDRLRYRTASPLPSYPDRSGERVAMLSRSTPGLLWPAWAARLSPGGTWDRFLRPAFSACVLITGTRIEIDTVAAELGKAIDPDNISRILQVLEDTPSWPQITAALTRLADHLARNPPPIDYRHRRGLDYTGLLPDEQWEDICRATGAFRGHGRKAALARAYLFGRLSGLPCEAAPDIPVPKDNVFRNGIAAFVTTRFPQLADALDEAGQDFLARHGVTGEPTVWQPPLDLITDLDLPGPDPRQVDISELHRLLLAGQSPSKAAAELGTTLAVVRCLLDEAPAPARQVSKGEGRLAGPRTAMVKKIDKDELARLHSEENLSFAQIANRFGTSRHVIQQLIHHYEIPVTHHGRRFKVIISREWLHEQHIVHGRTLIELAKIKGISPAAMNRWAKIHNIQTRRFGAHTHHPDLRGNLDAVPELLRPALTGPASWKRLRVLAELPGHPDIASAAEALSLHPATVWHYLDRLEKELSGELVHRAGKRRRTTTPTAFGGQVIQAVHDLERATGAREALGDAA